MSGFQLVTRKKGKKSRQTHVLGAKSLSNNDDPPDVNLTDLYKKINLSCEAVRSSQFYSDFKSILFKQSRNVEADVKSSEGAGVQQSFKEVVCYGLGNFAECVIARHQLGLLLALREETRMNDTKIHMFDPKFWKAEKEMLRRLNCNVLTINEEGKRRVTEPTLFFMPHCSKSLCNNLLWANWSPWQLSNLVIVGNSFNNICSNLPDRMLEQSSGYIKKILPYVNEHPLPENFQYSDIFNDTSVHFFPSDRIHSVCDEFWTDSTEPTYDKEDMEYIPCHQAH